MNDHWMDGQTPRMSRIFDIHEWVSTDERAKAMAATGCEVVLQTPHPLIPKSMAYPLEQVTALMGTSRGTAKPYLTNSVSYMIALAILEGYESIGVYGVDMAQDSEYGSQRPSCEYWLGLAVGKGITVTVATTSDLLRTAWLYGYDDTAREWMHRKLQARREYLAQQKSIHASQVELHGRALAELNGALENQEHILKVWVAKDGPV